MFYLTNEAAKIFNNDWTESLKIQSHVTEDLLIKLSGQLEVEKFFSSLVTPERGSVISSYCKASISASWSVITGY